MTGLRDTLISESTLCFTLSISRFISLSLSLSLSLARSHPLILQYIRCRYLSRVPGFVRYSTRHSVPFSSRIRRFLSRSGSERAYSFQLSSLIIHFSSCSLSLSLERLSFPASSRLSPSSKYVYSGCVSLLIAFPLYLSLHRITVPVVSSISVHPSSRMFLTFRLPFSLLSPNHRSTLVLSLLVSLSCPILPTRRCSRALYSTVVHLSPSHRCFLLFSIPLCNLPFCLTLYYHRLRVFRTPPGRLLVVFSLLSSFSPASISFHPIPLHSTVARPPSSIYRWLCSHPQPHSYGL